MKRYFLIILAVGSLVLSSVSTLRSQEEDIYSIEVGQSSFTPSEQLIPDYSTVNERFVIQFKDAPDAAVISKLKANGITLDRYIGGMSWYARRDFDRATPPQALAEVEVRSLVNINNNMKLSDTLRQYGTLPGEKKFNIRFFKDVDENQARSIISSLGFTVVKSIYKYSNTLEIKGDFEAVISASNHNDIMLIQPAVPAPKTHNREAAESTRVTAVQKKKSYRKVTGKSAKVGVWDGGKISAHNELKGRITYVEDGATYSGHATHVAGTIASSGDYNSRSRGMAPDARLYSGNYQGNPLSEMMDAVQKYGITLANNSWGTISGWEYEDDDDGKSYWEYWGDWMFGYYPDILADADDFIREDLTFLPLFSAGNDRADSFFGSHYKESNTSTVYKDLHGPDGDFNCTQTYANNKNGLTIGATTKDHILTNFSCKGPTDDGRLKPDLVAPGRYLYSTYTGGEYAYMSGTSMSCPVVTGVAALISDYYKERHKQPVRSDTLKNILIHSARDLGRPGPDYDFGHGMVDAELAARVVKKAVFGFDQLPGKFLKKDKDNDIIAVIVEGEIANKKKDIYKFNLPASGKELRATLLWHDVGGEKLVNNLDFTVAVKGKKKGKPWVLDPNKPTANAKPGTNKIDNVESILVEDVTEGAVTKIVVKGKSIPVGPQKYSLIVSISDGNAEQEFKTDQSFIHYNAYTTDSESSRDSVTTFRNTDRLWLKSEIQLTKNPSYGEYNASFSSTWTIIDPNGNVVMRTHRTHDNDPNETGYVWIFRAGYYEVVPNLPKGEYIFRVTFESIAGQSSTKESRFTIR